MKHRWELMCLSVRIDESYYQQTQDDQYIASFHRARSSLSSTDRHKYGIGMVYKPWGYGHSPNHMNMDRMMGLLQPIVDRHISNPHKRYATQSSTNSSGHIKNGHGTQSNIPPNRETTVVKRGREVSQSITTQTVVINNSNNDNIDITPSLILMFEVELMIQPFIINKTHSHPQDLVPPHWHFGPL